MEKEEMPYSEKYRLIKLGLLPKTGKKPPKPIPRQSDKKKQEIKEQRASGIKPAGKLELDKWFHDIWYEHTLNGTRLVCCMECKEPIPSDFFRHATAHLLPKKIFKSVATHPENYLILGAGCGCHEKTHRVDTFIKMKIWPKAARRIKILIPLLPIDELRHVSNQLLIALDNSK